MEQLKLALGVVEAAKAAGVGRTTLFEAIRKGQIVAKKVGRRTIITTEELDAWIKALPARLCPRGTAASFS
jgi:excisionase family DNA binding protein